MRTNRLIPIFLVLMLLAACGAAGPKIKAEEVWSRPAAAEGNGAAFMLLVNEGNQADRLLAAQADVAGVVEIHQTRMEGGVIKMQPVEGGLEVPARGQVELKPGGYHVMLIGLKQELKAGDRLPIILTFEKSGTLTVEAEVRMP